MESLKHISFSPDSKLIATIGSDETIRLFSVNGELLKEWKLEVDSPIGFIPEVVGFTPDGRQILVGVSSKDDMIQAIQVRKLNGELVNVWRTLNKVVDISFSPNGKEIAIGERDGTIQILNLEGELVRKLKVGEEKARVISFSSDGTQILTTGDEDTFHLWNIDGKRIKSWHFDGGIFAIRSLDIDSETFQVLSRKNNLSLRISLQYLSNKKIVKPWFSPNNVYSAFGHKLFLTLEIILRKEKLALVEILKKLLLSILILF